MGLFNTLRKYCVMKSVREKTKDEESKKELEKKWKKTEQEEMKEESHQADLKEGYEQDEKYEKSEE